MGKYSRILVIANETAAGRRLHGEISDLATPGAVVKVVVPALSSRLEYLLSDVDQPRVEAQRRLRLSLKLLSNSGIRAIGEIGDANPVRAFRDQLPVFEPDAVVISTHPKGKSHWLERNVVKKIEATTDLPVVHVVVDASAEIVAASLHAA